MSVKVRTQKREATEAELLDHGTENLLKAVKRKMVKDGGKVEYDRLRKEGYSDRFLARLEKA